MHTKEDLEKISDLASELIPLAKTWIDQGERGIALDHLIIEAKGKDPMSVQKEMGLSIISMHASIMLDELGKELCLRLSASYPHKNFRSHSMWGSTTSLRISDK